MIDSPHWPQVHVTEISEIDGELVESVITSPVCDFCGDQNPCWDYDCAQFDLEDFGSIGGWAACDGCSTLIEAEDYEGLLERSLDNPLGRTDPEYWRARIGPIHQGFWGNRIGERRA